MSYNKSVIAKTRLEFSNKQLSAKQNSDRKKTQLYSEIDGLREIDATLAETLASLTIEIARGPQNIDERINALKEKNQALQKKRAELLRSHGYPENYTDIEYECKKCNDTGYIGIDMCDCLKKALAHNTMLESGLAHLLDDQTFESFDLDFYRSNPIVYERMKENFQHIKNYAETFDENSVNLLFAGKTGLGKTHLSTALAKVVIDRGYNVCYESAQNIISDFEQERFGRSYNAPAGESKTDKYYNCDLLIIDDLGTEMVNSFTVSCLYNLLNTRLNKGEKILISTNLSSSELRSKYDERITSRIFGEFSTYGFCGEDVRQQKLKLL